MYQCSKFNNISVINVSLIRMYQYISNDNVHINASNKECSNIVLKLRKKKKKQDKRKPFINFCVCNPQEQTRTFTLKQTISLSFCKSFVFKIYTLYDNYPVRFRM